MNTNERVQFDGVCRGCLRVDENMHFLFPNPRETMHQNTPYLHQMLSSSTNINVTENDGLPRTICSQCANQLYSAYSFKEMCLRSDTELRRSIPPTALPREPPGLIPLPPPKRLDKIMQTESAYFQFYNCPDCQKKFSSISGLNKHLRKHCNRVETTVTEGISEATISEAWEPSIKLEVEQDDDLSDGIKEEPGFDDSDYEPIKIAKSEPSDYENALPPSKPTPRRRVPNPNAEKHPCELCPKVLSSKVHLQVHMAKHAGKTIPFSCSICKKGFNKHSHLQRHRVVHSPSRRLPCDVCGKTFSRSDHLERHVRSHRGPASPPPPPKPRPNKNIHCPVCQRGFCSQNSLERHIPSHGTPLALPCDGCELTFPTRRLLRAHAGLHRPEGRARPFLCSECGASFVRPVDLAVHGRRHRGEKPFACRYCPKRFTRRADLGIHERYHTEDKAHTCAVCGKSFHRQYNLTVHLRVHSGERPYSCSHCGKSFTQSSDLKAHVRRHTGERYGCELCERVFLQSYLLARHKRVAHQLDVTPRNSRVAKHPDPQLPPRQLRGQHRASRQRIMQRMQELLASVQPS